MNGEEIYLTIKAVCTELCKIIGLYEETECYNVVPEKGYADIREYMETKFAGMHSLASALSPDDPEAAAVAEKLHTVIDETEYFVTRFERPGTVTRWIEINPRLLFFDDAFELMEEISEENYLKMQQGSIGFGLHFYPDEEMMEARKKYFEQINRRNQRRNVEYSEERIFQNEMLTTLKYVFLNDFKEYLA